MICRNIFNLKEEHPKVGGRIDFISYHETYQ